LAQRILGAVEVELGRAELVGVFIVLHVGGVPDPFSDKDTSH
jgi:hypothetical protein